MAQASIHQRPVFFLYKNKITAQPFPGEVIRVDQKAPHIFWVYCDEKSRLSSHVTLYEMTLKDSGILFIKQPKPLKNFFYDCIQQKTVRATDLPQIIPPANDDDFLGLLGISKDTLAPNTYYWRAEQQFLGRSFVYDSLQYLEGLLYYRHSNGDQCDQWVRIDNGKTSKDILLASRADDPEVRISSSFCNDSTFVRTQVSRELQSEGSQYTTYEIDSTQIRFHYTTKFDFLLVDEAKYSYTQTQWTHENQWVQTIDAVDTKPFKLNGLNVLGRFEKVRDLKQSRTYFQYSVILISTLKSLITLEVPEFQGTIFDWEVTDRWVDVNLDGYLDLQWYDPNASGSAGSYYQIYLYQPLLQTFSVKPSELSGYDLQVNAKQRTVTSFGKSGYYSFQINIMHLNAKSQIVLTETYRCKEIGQGKLQLRYQKQNAKKILYQKSKEVLIENFSNRESIEQEMVRLKS